MDKPVFEKDIPAPKRGPRKSKYYWLAEMEVGDSFTCSVKEYKAVGQVPYSRNRKSSLASWLPPGYKLCRLKIGDDLYRVWRVA